MSPLIPVTVTHLELVSPTALRRSTAEPAGVTLVHHQPPAAARIAAEMYRRVGGHWHWRDRLGWTEADWAKDVHRDGVELWTLDEGNLAIGYFQLALTGDTVELKYFGLTEEGIGRGLGGWLLTEAVDRAGQLGAGRVVLNTCTLDGPAALPNYLARGFRVVHVEHQERELPA